MNVSGFQTAVTSPSSSSSSPYTPMSERQQLAMIKQMTEMSSTPDKDKEKPGMNTAVCYTFILRVRHKYHSLCMSTLPAPPPPLHRLATPSWPGSRLRARC